MSEVLQYVVVGLVVAVAVAAAVRSVARTMRDRKTALTACAGCKLQDYCQKPEKNSAKKCADKVAQSKNRQ